MIIGDLSRFAIESEIKQAYARNSLRALGFFNIHVDGCRYGVHEPEATMLACSFDEVRRRIAEQGAHTAVFANTARAEEIAYAFRNVFYGDDPDDSHFGIPLSVFIKTFESHHLSWAPDGDEAFDDESFILQFDVQDQVRIIAFKMDASNNCIDLATLRDVRLPAEYFYCILQQWHDAFAAEWTILPKIVTNS